MEARDSRALGWSPSSPQNQLAGFNLPGQERSSSVGGVPASSWSTGPATPGFWSLSTPCQLSGAEPQTEPPPPSQGPCRRAQSPNSAMSGPGSPTLAPAQLCSWPPPAAPAAGPEARAGTTDITIQLELDLEPETGGGLWGQRWRAGEEGGRSEGTFGMRRAQGFGGLDCRPQGQGVLARAHASARAHTHTHTHTHTTRVHRCPPNTYKNPRTPLMWLYRDKGNRRPLNTIC